MRLADACPTRMATPDAFLEARVKELTDGAQHPVMNRPQTVPGFPIALAGR